VELNNIELLKEKVIKLSKKSHRTPEDNTFTSDRMIEETIDLYYQLLSKEL
jgi:hypothetical protein